jgi:uncharacterized membrane protein YeaQ/YmgE (transglycosylase-associated protein family)
MPGFIYVLAAGAIVGLAARAVYPGRNNAHGFIPATVTGAIGVTIATSVGRWIHWVDADQLPDVVGMFAGAIVVLFVWNQILLLVWTRLVTGLGRFDRKNERETG